MSDSAAGRISQLIHTLKFITNHPLNRGRKLRALSTFVRWQIAGRLAQGPAVYAWVNEARMTVRPGETGMTGNIYCGLHEFADMAYLLHVTTPDDLFVDIGANVGAYTILACAVKGASGCCFEPVPATFGRLLDNLKINDLGERVEALNLGLADKEGELLFTSAEGCSNHVVVDGEAHSVAVRVKVMPLDSVLYGRSPSVLKIDVEGFETPVLAGAQTTLKNLALHSVIMELNGSGARYGFSEDAILQTMAEFGFQACRYEPFSRRLETLDVQKSTSGNTLFVRDLQRAREMTAISPKVAVGGVWL